MTTYIFVTHKKHPVSFIAFYFSIKTYFSKTNLTKHTYNAESFQEKHTFVDRSARDRHWGYLSMFIQTITFCFTDNPCK